MLSISQRPLATAHHHVSVRQVEVDVAHRGAQLITFADGEGDPLSWLQVAHGLVNNLEFCQRWHQAWADLPFDFEWKPIPIHPYTAKSHPFFVVVFPAQFRPADPSDFQPYLKATDALTATFANHSGDAQLLIPTVTGQYGHIAAFCRTAPPEAWQALWQRVGARCMSAIANETPVWCNTHGHGVPWLHVRFDSRLKYSAFPPRGSISPNSQAIWYKQIYEHHRSRFDD
ncbi:MAG: hypothetical protein AAFV90_23480 [Cyanobacteria bacterium J06634_5]